MLSGFRVAEVVEGRVGGLLSELEEVVPRAVEVVAVRDVVDDEVGRLAAVELDVGRLEVAVVPVVVLAGEAGAFSLDSSGLDLPTSSLPESNVESTGVAGGTSSGSASTGVGTGSSVDAILIDRGKQQTGGISGNRGKCVCDDPGLQQETGQHHLADQAIKIDGTHWNSSKESASSNWTVEGHAWR